jgi:hypothetical protein
MEIQDRQSMKLWNPQQTESPQAHLHCEVILPRDPWYEKARKVWNGMIIEFWDDDGGPLGIVGLGPGLSD